MKRIICLIVILLPVLPAFSGPPPWMWAKKVQGTGSAFPQAIVVDDAGNIFVSGWFDGTVDFDPGPAQFNLTAQGEDGFLLKLLPLGNFGWAVSFGGNGYDAFLGMDVDATGNIYCTGYYYDSIPYSNGITNDTLVSAGDADAFVVAFDYMGGLIWAGNMGGSGGDYGLCISASSISQRVTVVGSFTGTADLDPGNAIHNATASGLEDMFVCMTKDSGDFIRADAFGGASSYIYGTDIEMDSLDNVLITGYFDGSVDFDPSTSLSVLTSSGSPPGGEDAFLCKLDSGGALRWAKQIGGPDYTYSQSLSLDPVNGDVYVAGRYAGNTDFDPDTGTFFIHPPGDAGFLSRLDSSGNFVWANSVATSQGSIESRFTAAYLPAQDACHLSGVFQGGVDMDPGPGTTYTGSMGFDDIFISYFESTGTFRWVKQMGDVLNEAGVIMDLDPASGAPVIAGWFNSPSLNYGGRHLFNPSMIPALFVAELNYISLGAEELEDPMEMSVFPVPADNHLFLRSKNPGEKMELRIVDATGRLWMHHQGECPEHIDVSRFPSGLYWIEAKNKDLNFRKAISIAR